MTTETTRSRLRRLPQRGSTDPAVVDSILNEGLVCHVGFEVEGQPFVIPMVYGWQDGRIVLHGAPASRLQRALASGISVCVSVTLVDGLVLARSAMHHSMNYRSVVAFGRGRAVEDTVEKRRLLDGMVERLIPGRTAQARPPSEKELRATAVVAVEIEEISAKVRSGHPVDDADDLALDVWAGEIPLAVTAARAVDAQDLRAGIARPGHVLGYRGPGIRRG